MARVSRRRLVDARWAFALLLVLVPIFAAIPPHALSAQTSTAPPVAGDWPVVPGEIIVKFKAETTAEQKEQSLAEVGAAELSSIDELNAKLATLAPEEVAEALAELGMDPRVEYAEPNYVIQMYQSDEARRSNDPELWLQWGLDNTGQVIEAQSGLPGADIGAAQAWALSTGSPEVVVAVIDSGIDFGHPDLGGSAIDNPRMWKNPGETCYGCMADGLDNDGNGITDDWRGWDFVHESENPLDENGHGTHVAGIIGATGDNGVGIAGVNWQVTIMALKIFGESGLGETDAGARAVLYAAQKGADVINASWGGWAPSQTLRDAITIAGQQGVLFVAAAGNDGFNTDLFGHFPSGMAEPTIISVAATDNQDQLAGFSNYGLRSVDLGAPGVDVYSLWLSNSIESPYRYASGTSMASPHVAGAAALVKARFPDATPLGVKALLLSTAERLPALAGLVASGGRLDVGAAAGCNAQPSLWIEEPLAGFAAEPGQPVEFVALAANCAALDGLVVSADANGEPVTLTADGNGYYRGAWTPQQPGAVTITLTGQVGDNQATAAVSGEVVLNYQFSNAAFEWIDATDGGQQIAFADERDAGALVGLPFPFTFYDRTFEQITVGENGLISFGDSFVSTQDDEEIPEPGLPDGFIAPYWDDLDLRDGGSVWVRTIGEAPNRRLVVAWVEVAHQLASGAGTFELVLEEGSNEFLFQYQNILFGSASYGYGRSATIGVEHFTGTVGRQFAFHEPALYEYEGLIAIRGSLRAPDAPEVETRALEPIPTDQLYTQQLQAVGGSPPYTWSLAAGALPAGLSLDPLTGILAGTPYQAGYASFTVQATDSSEAARTAQQELALDVRPGYRITDTAWEWIDAGDGGEQLPMEDDDEVVIVPLPFPITMWGEAFSEAHVSFNGLLTFGDGQRASSFIDNPIPSRNLPNGVVAVYWDDLVQTETSGVWVRVVDAEPNRRLIIMWRDVGRYPDHGAATFEVILEEATQDIVYQYQDLDFGDLSYDLGASATIGVESPDGALAVQFSHEDTLVAGYIGTTGVRFSTHDPAELVPVIDNLPEGELRAPYHATLAVDGGSAPWNWAVSEGALPPGLMLDPASGALTGLPGVVGTFAFTAEVRDAAGQALTIPYSITILPSFAVSDGPFEWLAPGAGAVRLSYTDDDEGAMVELPFPFSFYGVEYQDLQVSTNGFLVFGDSPAGAFINTALPNPRDPNGVVAVFWDDLTPDTGGGVWVETIGEVGQQRFIVTWLDAPRFRDIGAGTFQIILEEGSNAIVMQYLDVEFGDARYDWGADATVGVEAPSGVVGTTFAFDQPVLAVYQGQRSLRFTPLLE